jgi:outer membrane protein assembly factor BamB
MNKILSLILILSITSCSSIAFWQSDEIDPDEPRELIDFNERFEFIENWETKFKGQNTLNNFIPAFSGNNLFFVDPEGNVSNMDIESGEVLWETELETIVSVGIVAGFGRLFLSDDQGNLICLDQEDGTIIWSSFAGGEVLANVDVDAGLVIVKTASGFLNAFDIETGEEEWSYRSQAPNLTVRGSSSPVINDNIVYATFDNGRIGAFNLKTGLPIWDGAISFTEGVSELDNLIDADSSPVLEGNRIYTVNFQGNLSVFDAAQRRAVWESKESSFYEPFILRGVLGIISADSKISTYSSRTFEDSWKLEEYALRELSNPETFKGYILVGDLDGYIHAIDPLTGITVARKKISRNKITTLISRSDSFYAIDEKMRLFSLSF